MAHKLRLKAITGGLALAALIVFTFTLGLGYAQTGGGFDLSWSTVDGGGATSSTGGTFGLGGTIGQPDAGRQTGGAFTLDGGFWGATTPICTTNANYQTASTTGAAIVPATTYVPGSTCNSCTVNITLPFSYSLYDTAYTSVIASNEGNLQFTTNTAIGANTCLPAAVLGDSIVAYWDDLNTNINDTMGIFTSVNGVAPNRIFNIRWAGGYVANDVRVDFEVRLYEGQPKYEVIYGQTRGGFSATIGVQKADGTRFTQYSCNTNGTVQSGLMLTFDRRVCSSFGSGKP